MKKIPRRDFIKSSMAIWVTNSMLSSTASIAAASDIKGEALLEKVVTSAVDDHGWIDYHKIQRTLTKEMDGFLSYIAWTSPAKFKHTNDWLAFWINAYNAICIRSLIDANIPHMVPYEKQSGKSIFTKKKYRVAGKVRSLDEIEHQIIRKQFRDNRVHAALVCGASSCPRLRREPYRGQHLDRQLDEECRQWIQRGKTKKGHRKNYLDVKNKVLYLSKIFDWFKEDFGNSEERIVAFVTRFASQSDRQFLKQSKVTIEYLNYDWQVNGK